MRTASQADVVASVYLLGMRYILAGPREPGRSFANDKHGIN